MFINQNERQKFHKERKREILAKNPNILKEMKVTNFISLYQTLYFIILQVSIFLLAKKTTFNLTSLITFFFTCTTLQTFQFQIIHNATHDCLFKEKNYNINFLKLIDKFIFLGKYGMLYRKIHSYHHNFEKSYTIDDVNIYNNDESNYIGTNFLYKSFYICFTGFRNLKYSKNFCDRHKIKTETDTLTKIILIAYLIFIPKILFLTLTSSLLTFANPLYPSLSEHYIFDDKNNFTNSYYGTILNILSLNMYYHKEHHDFEQINSHFYPKLRKEFPEKYPDSNAIKSKIITFYTIMLSSNYTLTEKIK